MARYLVTGGAGYIGSRVAQLLGERGDEVVVFDNLSTGSRQAVPRTAHFVHADLGDAAAVEAALARGIDGVLHFAARVVVPESVSDPITCYQQNTVNTLSLVHAALRAGVTRLVFSSSAAVYGQPDVAQVCEDDPTEPINPYGASKLMSEWMLRDIAAASDLRYVALRYFNVAGAAVDGSHGPRTPNAKLLVHVAARAAAGLSDGVTLFGTDFDTPDGTAVRDYIHVDDLARAHLRALDYLGDGGESIVLNCGYGRGASVREVLSAMQRVSGVDFPIAEGPRRPGDPACLIADARRARAVIGFEPECDDLELICRTTWAWEMGLR